MEYIVRLMKSLVVPLLTLLIFIDGVFGTNSSTTTDDNDDSREELAAVTILLFMFLGLTVGIIIMQLLARVKGDIPYTCVVFLFGVLSSLITKNMAGALGKSIFQWAAIDAELLLFVFLPPLIFGEAMTLNWYHVKGGMLQSLLLAGPGVFIGAGLMGWVTKLLIPTWTWALCMTFGSILSATDPIAVVSLLNSASASPKLTILIVGESLLNDGTSIVLFTVFYDILNGDSFTPGEIITYFLEATVGSVALGIIFGLVCVRWLRTANRPLKEEDSIVQIGMTLCIGYLTFFTAQYWLEISGVLACVSAGIMVAWLGPPLILSHEKMHSVWEMINWVLNTMIFLIAGLIIGNQTLSDINNLDWLYLIVLYLALMAIRFLVILVLYPWLSTIGHPCTWREAVFISWAGLRGALGMALGLLVEKNGPENMKSETSKMFFYVGGIAALTLVINATTAKALLVFLGLLGEDSLEKRLVISQVTRRLQKRMDKVIGKMAAEFNFTEDDIGEVRNSSSLMKVSPLSYGLNRPSIRISARHNQSRVDSSTVATTSSSGEEDGKAEQDKKEPNIRLAPLSNGEALEDCSTMGDSFLDSADSLNALEAENIGSVHARLKSKDMTHERDRMKSTGSASHASRHLSSSMSQRRRSSYGIISFNALSLLHDKHLDSTDHPETRYARVCRLLEMSHRGERPVLIQEVLSSVRAVFLEIVRVKYWEYIESGKLPRLSKSTQTLLYTVDVGCDEVERKDGARDWVCLEQELDGPWPVAKALMILEQRVPFCFPEWTSYMLSRHEARLDKRSVYTLTSFIEAHEHAQRKISYFVGGVDEELGVHDIDESLEHVMETTLEQGDGRGTRMASSSSTSTHGQQRQSPEELRVIAESKEAVEKARFRLNLIDEYTVSRIKSKQASQMVLHKEAEQVKVMMQEGLLTPEHAEEFLETISKDAAQIERDRNKLYRNIENTHAERRSEMKKQERRSLHSYRPTCDGQYSQNGSLFSSDLRGSLYNAAPYPTSSSTPQSSVPLLDEERERE